MAKGPRVAILGAGSIGCYVGGAWAAAGLPVTLVGRERIGREIAEHGLALSDFTDWEHRFAPEAVDFATDPKSLGDADVVIVTVKSGGTEEAARDIAAHARKGATIVSLQNGVANVAILERILGDDFEVAAAMVPFNVVNLGGGRFHKGVAGALWADDRPAIRTLADSVAASHEPLSLSDDMTGLAWGKLVINLNNAVNALSGKTLRVQLGNRDYRRVVAASQVEALALLKAAKIAPAKVGPLPPRLVPFAIGAPDWLFRHLFARGWKIDEKARSSMADDLAQGRKTEIDALNGEVVNLARSLGREAPINRRIVELVRRAEDGAPHWSPAALRREVLGR